VLLINLIGAGFYRPDDLPEDQAMMSRHSSELEADEITHPCIADTLVDS